ncbi:MAG: hypothetical protein MI919_23970, partial [Holophagales bacterium]|nr:hypothetical protein [Holophagales bacterium]
MIEKAIHPSTRVQCLPGLCLLGLCLMSFLACSPSAPPPASDQARPEALSLPAAAYAYRNAVNKPPPDWEGPVFELSRDYPSSMPAECPPSECPWLAVDVDFNSRAIQWDVGWSTYMQSIL